MAGEATAAEKNKDSFLVDVEQLKRDVETYQHTTYNNRRYASSTLGHYYMPNDSPEIHRLNEQHFVLTTLKDGSLHHAPIDPSSKPGFRILDVGCGSGIWCVEIAAKYPDAMITGMDVSPIQPKAKPASVEWIVHDMEKPWPFAEEYFDLIHLSLVHGCVVDWNGMMGTLIHHLAPGGYIEHQEFNLCRNYFVSVPPSLTPHRFPDDVDLATLPPILRWGRYMETAGEKRGRTLQLGPKLLSLQKSSGLQDVSEKIFVLPCGTWPEDAKGRMLGARNMLQILSGMEGFTMVMFTKVLGWEVEETKVFLEECKRDLRDDDLRQCMDVHVVWGRKEGGDDGVESRPEEAWKGLWGLQSVQFASGVLFGGAVVAMVAGWVLRSRVR